MNEYVQRFSLYKRSPVPPCVAVEIEVMEAEDRGLARLAEIVGAILEELPDEAIDRVMRRFLWEAQ